MITSTRNKNKLEEGRKRRHSGQHHREWEEREGEEGERERGREKRGEGERRNTLKTRN
jgi:hypothetical protein